MGRILAYAFIGLVAWFALSLAIAATLIVFWINAPTWADELPKLGRWCLSGAIAYIVSVLAVLYYKLGE